METDAIYGYMWLILNDLVCFSAKMAQNFFGESDMLRATISSSGAVLYSPQTSASFLCNVTSDKSGELVSCVQRIGKSLTNQKDRGSARQYKQCATKLPELLLGDNCVKTQTVLIRT